MKHEVLRLERINCAGELILEDIKVSIYKGELLGIIGQNQSGKTILGKLMAGYIEPDSGKIYVDGKAVKLTAEGARREGIYYLNHQACVIPGLSISENIYWRQNVRKLGIIKNKKRLREQAGKLFDDLEIGIDLDAEIGDLDIADIHVIQICGVLMANARLIILDCITGGYTKEQVERLNKLLQHIMKSGVAVVYIQDNIDPILYTAERVAAIIKGHISYVLFHDEFSRENIIKIMEKSENIHFKKKDISQNKEIFHLEKISVAPWLRDITLSIREGEILGFFLSEREKQRRLSDAFNGIRPMQAGAFVCGTEKFCVRNTGEAISHGIAVIRRCAYDTALFHTMSAGENVAFFSAKKFGYGYGIIHRKKENYIERYQLDKIGWEDAEIRPGQADRVQRLLLVMERWRLLKPGLLVMECPTFGIDLFSRDKIYQEILSFAEDGVPVILLTNNPDELANLCHRVIFPDKNGNAVQELYDCRFEKIADFYRQIIHLIFND